MSSRARITLRVGETVLTERGASIVRDAYSHGVELVAPDGTVQRIDYTQLTALRGIEHGRVDAVAESLEPLWSLLRPEAKIVALDRLEVVLEILTGYRRGHVELALPGEPHGVFDRVRGVSLRRRCLRMAEQLSHEAAVSRPTQRRLQAGELKTTSVSASTVRKWVSDYDDKGVFGLIDGRQTRGITSWTLDPVVMQVLDDEVNALDGGLSSVSNQEIIRRARVTLKLQAHVDTAPNEAQVRQYVSHQRRHRGHTTRSQRTHKVSSVQATTSFPALRPGQIVAIDATRFDNMVRDPVTGRVYSVEILTAIDVATRVVLGLRVTPRSANSADLSMLMYDVMRPTSMLVDGTTVHDWRWVGVPESIERIGEPWWPELFTNNEPSLQGEHLKPGLYPESVRCDNGSIFVGRHFVELLTTLQIDLLPSRGKRPMDNSIVERLHSTYETAIQQWPGYKGRSVAERGTSVGVTNTDSLLHPAELERYLRRWVALDYHRRPHDGLFLPGAEDLWLSPLTMYDALIRAAGRIHVLQRPDLIFDFLRVELLTPSPSGVERRNLTYDCAELAEFRNVRTGQFIPGTRQMPFFVDPHDLSRIWFRHPDTQAIVEVPWKAAYKLMAPLTEVTLSAVRRATNNGHARGAAHAPAKQILDTLTDLMTPSAGGDAHWGDFIGERLRHQRSQFDHAHAAAAAEPGSPAVPSPDHHGPKGVLEHDVRQVEPSPSDLFGDEWPDYDAAGY